MSLFDEFYERVKKRYADYIGVEQKDIENEKPRPEDFKIFENIKRYILSQGLPQRAVIHYVDYYYGMIKQGNSFSLRGLDFQGNNAVPHYVHFCTWYKANYYRIKDDDEAVFNICWSIRYSNDRLENLLKSRQFLGVERLDIEGGMIGRHGYGKTEESSGDFSPEHTGVQI